MFNSVHCHSMALYTACMGTVYRLLRNFAPCLLLTLRSLLHPSTLALPNSVQGGVFNLVFSFRPSSTTTTSLFAVGRFYQDVRQMFDCRHVSRFTWPHMSRWPHVNYPQPRNTVAYIEDVFKDSASR